MVNKNNNNILLNNNNINNNTNEKLPEHISYSAISTYIDCGQKYFLTRVMKAPEPPAWYFIGGSALHEASEIVDDAFAKGLAAPDPTQTFSEVFQKLLTAEVEKSGVPASEFKAGGRASKAWPEKENRDWWLEHGPKMLQSWISWRNGSGWQLWVTPDGVPAVELSVEYTVGDSEIKMFIDRVMVTPDGELVILDLKTGSRTPSSDLQLAVYAAGIERKYGVRASYGAYWMARDGITSQLSSLDYLPSERVEALVENFDKARKSGIFLPNTTNCFYCGVAQYCEWSKK
jgi:hypothetical protein